jgi:hypothetical protein
MESSRGQRHEGQTVTQPPSADERLERLKSRLERLQTANLRRARKKERIDAVAPGIAFALVLLLSFVALVASCVLGG